MRSLDGFSAYLEDDCRDVLDEEGRHTIERIRAGAQRMGQLFDDLLDLSRVGRSDLASQPVDLSAMALETAAELRAGEPERAVETVIAQDMIAEGDPRLLGVVLQNLLSNAWKFKQRQTAARVEVGEREIDGQRVFFVRDNGVGFDMAYAENLFVPFQRLHAEHDFSGSGIGLATVQRIIVRQGATFFFTLGGAA